MERYGHISAAIALTWALLVAAPAGAAPASGVGEDRLETLDQKVRILERKWEIEQESASAKAKDTQTFGAGKEGFFLRSADKSFQLNLRGYAQVDGRFFFGDDEVAGVNQFLLRRVRPILDGIVFQRFEFRIMPDFGEGKTVLQDAYLGAAFAPWAKVRVGKFKEPFGLERLQSATDILFVERALPTNLVPNRDVGVQFHGELLDGALNYALGVFNGVPDGGSADGDVEDDKDFAGRIFAHPFRKTSLSALQGLGIGAAATYGDEGGSPKAPFLPSFKTAGQQTFFTYRADAKSPDETNTTFAKGRHFRLSPQATYYWGPVGLLSEYVVSSQEVRRGVAAETLRNNAWQVSASYVLTGEDASYKGVKPRNVFDPAANAWGALELAARYGALRIDVDTFPTFADPAKAAREARAWAVGVNWYLNRAIKTQVDYESTAFEGGAPGGDREQEKVLFTRAQVAF